MGRKTMWHVMAAGVGLSLTLALTLGSTRAQMQPMGTAFTYQGRLTSSGAPVNSACDFQFSLWDALSGGSQIGGTQFRTSVNVNAGYFTVSDLDFGTGVFNGLARWLAIQVRCPAGSGSYTSLSPRQALRPAPHALALPGLWTEQNPTSPNLIGGFPGNQVTNTVHGATIGGGGAIGFPNRVTDNYGTVGGGVNNRAGDDDSSVINNTSATVGGGQANVAGGAFATASGGYSNTAMSLAASIGGGFINMASADYATIGGGRENTASGNGSTVGGGGSNTASSSSATVGGGFGNIASGIGATVGGGGYDGTSIGGNQATGNASTVGGGHNNTASGLKATVGGGQQNVAGGVTATVGGGQQNIAGGIASTVGGGHNNFVSANSNYGTVGGGQQNVATMPYATIGGGASNLAASNFSTIGGGDANQIEFANHATIGGGQQNVARGSRSTIPGGYGARADYYGQMAYASGFFSATGDAQMSVFVLRGTTDGSHSTATELFLDGVSQRLALPNKTIYFEAMIVGRDANGNSAGYRISGVVDDHLAVTGYVGSASVDLLEEDVGSWDVAVTPNSFDATLRITALSPGSPARWVAVVRTVEVRNP